MDKFLKPKVNDSGAVSKPRPGAQRKLNSLQKVVVLKVVTPSLTLLPYLYTISGAELLSCNSTGRHPQRAGHSGCNGGAGQRRQLSGRPARSAAATELPQSRPGAAHEHRQKAAT